MSSGTTFSDRLKLARFRSGGWVNASLRLFSFNALNRLRLFGPVSEELLIAPQDLRTTDPTLANDFYAGYFPLAGVGVDCKGQSPFEIVPPSDSWQRELMAFGWLRHLRASKQNYTKLHARSLVDDWIRDHDNYDTYIRDMEGTARRVMSWICHSPMLLDGCDHGFYSRFMRSLSRQVRFLRLTFRNTNLGMPRFLAAIALTYAAVSISGHPRFVQNAMARLDRELVNQFLPDGGHVGRNPQAVVDALSLLLPLRQAIVARDLVPSKPLVGAIERMMPMLRFFRMGDGNFARFNGMSDTPIDLLAAILAHDEVSGRPVMNASYSGYQRLSAEETVVLMETGTPPPQPVSGTAHAGCLSFELSSGASPIIINCGSPGARAATDAQMVLGKLSRLTAAHSTIEVGEASSCHFMDSPRFEDLGGMPILSGPKKVPVDRTYDDGLIKVVASHDGYAKQFGLVHQRELELSHDGLTLTGRDALLDLKGEQLKPTSRAPYLIRFHLHFQVAVTPAENGEIELRLPNKEKWVFSASGGQIAIDESIMVSEIYGNRSSKQIVISGISGKTPVIEWQFQRLS